MLKNIQGLKDTVAEIKKSDISESSITESKSKVLTSLYNDNEYE